MADDKDRLKETFRKKEKAEEDRYFAERDKAVLERLRKELTPKRWRTIREVAHGRCPRCLEPLGQEELMGVTIDRCPHGHGIWLDDGELEMIAGRERDSWLGRLFFRPRR